MFLPAWAVSDGVSGQEWGHDGDRAEMKEATAQSYTENELDKLAWGALPVVWKLLQTAIPAYVLWLYGGEDR